MKQQQQPDQDCILTTCPGSPGGPCGPCGAEINTVEWGSTMWYTHNEGENMKAVFFSPEEKLWFMGTLTTAPGGPVGPGRPVLPWAPGGPCGEKKFTYKLQICHTSSLDCYVTVHCGKLFYLDTNTWLSLITLRNKQLFYDFVRKGSNFKSFSIHVRTGSSTVRCSTLTFTPAGPGGPLPPMGP